MHSANSEGIKSDYTNPMVLDNNKSKINLFLPGSCQEADRKDLKMYLLG